MAEAGVEEAAGHFDIDKKPVIESVQDTGDDLDSDEEGKDEVEKPAPVEDKAPAGEPGRGSLLTANRQQQSKENPRPARRTRGVSLLPVRQANEPSRVASSPPHTPSPLKPLSVHDLHTPAVTPGSAGSGSGVRRLSATKPTTPSNTNIAALTPTAGSSASSAPLNNDILNTYFSQLAAKEARVGDLRSTIHSLQEELREAESELNEFKENGKKLAEIVHGGAGSSDGTPLEARTSSPRNAADLAAGHKDMIGIGKRVVDEIGTQFWSFLEDVKSATMGNVEFEQQQHAHHGPRARSRSPVRLADGRGPLKAAPPLPSRPPTSPGAADNRSPSPPRRQLSPKRSIQNFIRNRSPSPIRSSLSPSRSPDREELANYHASQRMRESERLTKKLSHIDLRAPNGY